MKTFKEFTNEGAMGFLKPKSEEEILQTLNNMSEQKKIKYIIIYQLDYNLLPRNKSGICIYENNLWCFWSNDNKLNSLPDNLTVNGSLYCNNNKLNSLPDNLTVNGSLYCNNNQLTELPDNLIVNGRLYCRKNKIKLELPKDAYVGGKFIN